MLQWLATSTFSASHPHVEHYLNDYWQQLKHGDHPRWKNAIDNIAQILGQSESGWLVEEDHLHLAKQAFTNNDQTQLEQNLREFMPWRKGPLSIGPTRIDTEWRSDWKWQRLEPHVDWQGKSILDVGSGNGYYGYRMLAAGAASVIGVDPTVLFIMQSQLMQQCAGYPNNWVLPMTLEQTPPSLDGFDIVLSLGVLYHRKDPVEHIQQLMQRLKPGGQLVLETFVLPPGMGDSIEVERYARMRNVYEIPSVDLLQQWFEQAGCTDVRMVDFCRTGVEEQRTTDWMRFESLRESLDEGDSKVTVEGWPGPVRVVCLGGG